MATPTSLSDLRRARIARRVPRTLAELRGPESGVIRLPLSLAWSGLTEFDLDRPRLRMSCYRIVLAEGVQEDLTRFLNRALLTEMWPVLRTLVSRDIRDVWEATFPELKQDDQAVA
ncbi:transcriptional regulator [Streptomyces sp. NPDC006368]|uniref:transcriptional regulator n=1 Tax=Streptomyces sp. NPDC006368 TaxID=3156760 RepID=UPI00339F7594